MIFWITVLALTTATIIFAFMPALRSDVAQSAGPEVEEFEHDIAVYRDQLTELEGEQERGLISKEDAGQARAEIVRRLLSVEEKRDAVTGKSTTQKADKFGRFALLAAALIFVPGLSLLMYSSIGSPTVEAQPLAARLEAMREAQMAQDANNAQLIEMVSKAEGHLRENPEDGRGWDVLAPVYMRLGDNEKSATAYRNSIRLLGESPARLSGLGEVTVVLAQGLVSAEASDLFARALKLNPLDGRSLYYSAIGVAQSGQVEEAFAGLQAIALNEAIEGDWRAAAANTIAQMGERRPAEVASNDDATRPPALDQETIDQMGEMPAGDRQEMIVGMVQRLETRLANEGGSVEEWQRLIRAHFVLNQRQEALDAVSRAIEANAGKENEISSIRQFAEGLGLVLEGSETQ